MKKTLIACCIMLPLVAQAQLGSHGRLISDFLDPNSINTETFYMTQYKDIAGSPYIEDRTYPGTVVLKDGTRVEELQLRYNGYEDAVFYEMEDKKAAMIDPELIAGFEYENGKENVKFISAVIFEEKKNFFEVIYEGKVSLYVYHKITLSKKTDNTGGYGTKDLHGAAFKLNDKYIFMDEGGVSSEIKLTKKSLLEVMEHTSKMEKYIKEKKLKVKEHKDLVTLFQYYDSVN